jgi:predicted RNA-binding Zn-ribbon protein involved in translation (DUF1610 family)
MKEKNLHQWMYCFTCGASHLHEQQVDGSWKCPNCGTKRKHSPVTSDAAAAKIHTIEDGGK